VKELGVRSRPTRTDAARDVEPASLPFPWPDRVRMLNPRPRPVVDSDPLALVYPGADSDALSLPDVNLNEEERVVDDVDTASLRTLEGGNLASRETGT
jgi:hypothetical protein